MTNGKIDCAAIVAYVTKLAESHPDLKTQLLEAWGHGAPKRARTVYPAEAIELRNVMIASGAKPDDITIAFHAAEGEGGLRPHAKRRRIPEEPNEVVGSGVGGRGRRGP